MSTHSATIEPLVQYYKKLAAALADQKLKNDPSIQKGIDALEKQVTSRLQAKPNETDTKVLQSMAMKLKELKAKMGVPQAASVAVATATKETTISKPPQPQAVAAPQPQLQSKVSSTPAVAPAPKINATPVVPTVDQGTSNVRAITAVQRVPQPDDSDNDGDEYVMPKDVLYDSENEDVFSDSDGGDDAESLDSILASITECKTIQDLDVILEQVVDYQEPEIDKALFVRRGQLAVHPFDFPLVIDTTDNLNGYPVPPISHGGPFMSRAEFDNICNKWKQEQGAGSPEWRVFAQQFKQVAPEWWYITDTKGEPIESVMQLPKESRERLEAGQRVLLDNCKALYNLPYPKAVLLALLNIGGIDVPTCNILAEWVKRKASQIAQRK